MACDCISETNKLLAEHNTVLVTTMFRKPDAVVVATDKLASKQRGKPALMIASFCPFCGEPYSAQKEAGNG